MQDDDKKSKESGNKEEDRNIGKDVPFKKSYRPEEDNLSKPPRESGGPRPTKQDDDKE